MKRRKGRFGMEIIGKPTDCAELLVRLSDGKYVVKAGSHIVKKYERFRVEETEVLSEDKEFDSFDEATSFVMKDDMTGKGEEFWSRKIIII